MRKVIGVCAAFCFFVNNFSFALTPALKFGDLGGETYHQKFLYYAESALQKDLLELHKTIGIRNADSLETVQQAFSKNARFKKKQIYFSKKTIFNPLRVKAFFNLLEHAGGNIFAVPLVVKQKHTGVIENYRLLFSTVYDEKNEGFPIFYCTKEEFDKVRTVISLRNALPKRNKKENERLRLSMSRYGAHDGEIDEDIKACIKAGHFTEFENRAKNLGWNKKYKERKTPKSYLPKVYFDYIKTEIDVFLKYIDADVNTGAAFKDKNIVLLGVPKWAKFSEVNERGTKLKVTSHASENAVYKFLSKEKIDLLIAKNGLTNDVKNILNEVVVDFIHEIGAIYRLKWWFSAEKSVDDRKIISSLDVLYRKYKRNRNEINKNRNRKRIEYVLTQFTKGRRNLDYLYFGNTPRDYASAEDPEMDGDEDIRDNYEKKFPDIAKVMEEISKVYDDYGVDHKSLAEAFREAPFAGELDSLETGDVVEYMTGFFKKLFGDECEVEKKVNMSKNEDHTDIEINVGVNNLSYTPGESVDGLTGERDGTCGKYRFQVFFDRKSKKDDDRLSVRIQFPLEQKPMAYTRLSTASIQPKKVTAIMQDIAAKMIAKEGIPEGVRSIIAANVVDFSKMNEKSGLIFSKTAVFDNGLGMFLPKLARAGIQIAVVAPEQGQKDAIALLNEKEKVKIVCLDHVGDAFNAIPASSYYYFATKDDPDIGEIEGIILCDITDKIAIIIRALAEANHVTDVDTIKFMEELADRFRQAV